MRVSIFKFCFSETFTKLANVFTHWMYNLTLFQSCSDFGYIDFLFSLYIERIVLNLDILIICCSLKYNKYFNCIMIFGGAYGWGWLRYIPNRWFYFESEVLIYTIRKKQKKIVYLIVLCWKFILVEHECIVENWFQLSRTFWIIGPRFKTGGTIESPKPL